jgi:hypothetical protein
MGGCGGSRPVELCGLLRFVLESPQRRLVHPFGGQHGVRPIAPFDYEGAATPVYHHLDVAAASSDDCSANDVSHHAGTQACLKHGTDGCPEAASAHRPTSSGCSVRRGDGHR